MPGMFAGRIDELIELEKILLQTKKGNPAHFLVTGERGIGKSSLFFYLRSIAAGTYKGICGSSSKFLVVNVELEKNFTQIDILERIGSELQREVGRTFEVVEIAKSVWAFLRKWEVLGVSYEQGEELPAKPFELLDELALALGSSSARLTIEGYDGILILIDEADKPNAAGHLGQIIKNLTEKLVRNGTNNVVIGIAGLPEVISIMRESHESSPRILKPFVLNTLAVEERKQAIAMGLQEAREKNGYEVTITPEAENLISELSEGYPNFIQQFAYCAFEADSDNMIDLQDVQKGAHGPRGAIEELGTKYFADLFFDKINSDDYRKVLQVMAERDDGFVTKAEIKADSGLKKTTLSNAINVLKERKIIRPKEGTMGVYRLPTKSFAVWIRSLTKRA
jgi:hypothetical protein